MEIGWLIECEAEYLMTAELPWDRGYRDVLLGAVGIVGRVELAGYCASARLLSVGGKDAVYRAGQTAALDWLDARLLRGR